MDFLVRITVSWPTDGDPSRREELRRGEAAMAEQLAREGILQRMWRVPGRWANVGIWRAPDATALHDALCRLPFYPWLSIDVEPLAVHPSDPGEGGIAR